jgi:hypothetical protein
LATSTYKKRIISYLGRDFQQQKSNFINHLKVYFPNTYQDFQDSSSGMMLTEIGAFFGDIAGYYIDKRFNESYTETAQEVKNVFKHAKQLGFKAFGKTAANRSSRWNHYSSCNKYKWQIFSRYEICWYY